MAPTTSVSLPTFDADAPTATIAAALEVDGGAIVHDLAAPALMDEVYDEVRHNTTAADLASSTKLWPEGNKTVGALAALSPTYANHLLVHPTVLALADAMLRPAAPMAPGAAPGDAPSDRDHYRVHKNTSGGAQLVVRAPDPAAGPNCHHYHLGASVMLEVHPGGEHQMLHRENGIYQPYIEALPMHEFILSVMWAGTRFGRDNGATRLVPGSHRWPETRIAEEHEIASAEMPKGSAVFWLSRTLHGAGKSTTPGGRTGFFHSMIPNWFRQEENQYLAVPPETARRLSEPALQLIGYRASRAVGWVKGRDIDNLLKPGSGAPI